LYIVLDELALKDLETILNVKSKQERQARTGIKEAKILFELMVVLEQIITDGKTIHQAELTPAQRVLTDGYRFLTDKPILIVANLSESEVNDPTQNAYWVPLNQKAEQLGAGVLHLSARIEQEISELEEDEAKEYIVELGWEDSGLNRLIKAGFELLGLITYLTTGEIETRAWTLRQGMLAPEAAGVIHTDMQKGFIRMETVSYQDLVDVGSWSKAREKGVLRQEGKEYIVKDGDVVHFLFNN